jgi:predicted nucleotidyltransferase
MMSITNKPIKNVAKKAIPILKKNGVVKAGIFGSFVRGEQKKKSDIDFVIKFKGRKSLLDLVGLKQELEENLNTKVDILTYKSIHPLLRDNILKEEVKIL